MKEKGNEESEITLHFVILEKMLSKAGTYKDFCRVALLNSFLLSY